MPLRAGGGQYGDGTISDTVTTAASQSSNYQIPGNGRAARVDCTVQTPFSAGSTLQVGQTGSAALLVAAGEFNLQDATGVTQTKFVDVAWGAAAKAVLYTIAGAPGAGSATITTRFSNSVNS